MKIFLLTHERELNRVTNTGSIARINSGGVVERILWERVNPNKNLVSLIEKNDALLLHLDGDHTLSTLQEYDNIIILDGTWQESRKMYNKSDYLKNAPKFTLGAAVESVYKLRRNQPKGGLCTIECVIEVLKIRGESKLASELQLKFQQFNV